MSFLTSDQKYLCRSLGETRDLAETLARALTSGTRFIFLFDGEMGAGKTQFIRYLIEFLRPLEATDERSVDQEGVTSPSFSIHNRYETSLGPLDHIDLYRVQDQDDLESTGFWDLFLNPSGLVLIEWGSRLNQMNLFESLPRTWSKIHLQFRIVSESTREIAVLSGLHRA